MLHLIPRSLILLVMVLTLAVYWPGLHGPFLFDDGPNIVSNQHLRIEDFSSESLLAAAFSIPNGIFDRPLSMLSFALNFYADRHTISPFLSAFPFKVVNLAIHVLNGFLIFILSTLLVAAYREKRQPELPASYASWLALAVASAWLLHPLNLTSVLYVVQRMASLAALFSLLGLILYVWGRSRIDRGQCGGVLSILASLLVCFPLAFLSKETGLLLPLFMLSIEVILFRFESEKLSGRQFLIGFFAIVVALPALLVSAYLALHPEWVTAGYAKRDFGLAERLMTEARVLWFYLRLIIVPRGILMGIFHDDVAVSRDFLDPATTLPAILGVLGLLFAVVLFFRRQPLIAFGIGFFLVGHSLESTIYPLELIHEHRNYLPMFGILLAMFHLLLTPIQAATTWLPRRLLALLLVPLFAFITVTRANAWSSPQSLWTSEVENHPTSVRANVAAGDFYAGALTLDPAGVENNYRLARNYFQQALVPGFSTSGLFGLIELSIRHSKPIERIWLESLRDALTNETIPPDTNARLTQLALCKIDTKCPLSDSTLDGLMRAPLGNAKVVGRERALMYNALTTYFFRVVRDYPAAVEAARTAVALDPSDLEHRMWLVTTLISMKQIDEAVRQINLLKRADAKNKRAQDIALLEEQIIQAR